MINPLLNYKEFLLGLILTLSLLWPLFAGSYFTHHDDVQVIRLFEMDKCFKDGQIPCRWVPDLGGLYGYPLFNYYAPLPYYFGELVYLLSGSLLISVKVMFALSILGAYVFMYLLGVRLWGKLGGFISGVFYSFAPYHAVDLYVRGAMGELWGLMLFPALFWAFLKLEKKTNIPNLILCAIFIAALITSHNLSAMLFLPVTFIWVLVLFLKNRIKKFILYSLASALLGILISAFYLFPMLLEKNLVHVETTTYGYFSYTEHFKGFRKLLLERSWGWGSSIREVPGGERDGLSYQVGWIHLLGFALALAVSYKLWRQKRWLSCVIIFSTAVAIFSMFMVNPRSEFIWKQIEFLKFLQFPWRFLLLTIFFISLISGSIVLILSRRKNFVVACLILAVVVANFFYFTPEKFNSTTDKELLSGENWDRQIKRSIFDYLPIFAKEPPAELASQRYQILTGQSNISEFREGTNWFKFKADAQSHSIIRLSKYYFPDWKIFVDGKETTFEYKDNTLGLMTVILGKGEHNVEGRLYDTPIRSISNLITFSASFFAIILFMIQLPTLKHWIEYYRRRII